MTESRSEGESGAAANVSIHVPLIADVPRHRPDIPLETPWKRLRVHDDVKVGGRFGVGGTDWLMGLR